MSYGPGTPLQIPGMPLAGFLPRSADRAAYVAAITAAVGQAPGANFGLNQFCYHLDLANFIIAGNYTHTNTTPADNLTVFAPSYSLVTAGPSGGTGFEAIAAEALGGKYYVLTAISTFHPPLPPSISYTLSVSGPNLSPTSSVSIGFPGGGFLVVQMGMRLINSKLYLFGNFTHIIVGGTTYTRAGIVVIDPATLTVLSDTFPITPATSFVTDVRGTATDIFVTGFRSLSATGSTAKGIFKFDAITGALDATFYATFCNTDTQDDPGQRLAIDEVNGFVYISGNFLEMNNSDPANPGVSRTALAQLDIITGSLTSWNPVLGTLNIDPSSSRPFFQVWGIEADPVTGNVYVGGCVNSVNGTPFGLIGDVLVFGLDPSATITAVQLVGTTSPGGFSNSAIENMLLNNGDLIVVGSFSTVGGSARGRGFSVSTTTGLLGSFNPKFDGAGISVRYG